MLEAESELAVVELGEELVELELVSARELEKVSVSVQEVSGCRNQRCSGKQ